MPRFDTVAEPPANSSGLSFLARARSASDLVSRASAPSDLRSASRTTGVMRPLSGSDTAMPTCTPPWRTMPSAVHDTLAVGDARQRQRQRLDHQIVDADLDVAQLVDLLAHLEQPSTVALGRQVDVRDLALGLDEAPRDRLAHLRRRHQLILARRVVIRDRRRRRRPARSRLVDVALARCARAAPSR